MPLCHGVQPYLRMVLLGVAVAALPRAASHSKAGRVEIPIQKVAEGKPSRVGRVLNAKGGNRLRLLGMRERLGRVGRKFTVQEGEEALSKRLDGIWTVRLGWIPRTLSGMGRTPHSVCRAFGHIRLS